MVAHKHDDAVSIVGRQGKESNRPVSELAKALASLPARSFILDGEVAVTTGPVSHATSGCARGRRTGGRPCPSTWCSTCSSSTGRTGARSRSGNGRRVLEELIARERLILPVRRLSSNGLKAWAQAVHKGYEGLVGKDPESPYVGGLTLKWLKVKQPKYREGERGVYKS